MVDGYPLLTACLPRLRRYARALVSDTSLADDLVQDTLERAWHKLELWRPSDDMRAWLFGIMHNLHVNQVRKTRLPTVTLDDEALTAPTRATQSDNLEVRDLHTALQLLPREQRAVLLLVALEQMTYQEIALSLEIPIGTVMSRLARGREKLRLLMEGATANPAPSSSTATLKLVK
ncbi:MAG: RNA polymerase sigma factor [Undibacterium sp.]|uniref:RNA polymerase sigma factor n=1 Tax=Undibacterium sp. TaxID=1914977 RepID=UPI002725C241|nr:RNA polymerase sigma factor [Undibacterium sp.]MDO8650598.1 RNA polymerase sigma factor [Undibacterium sp.]